MQHMFHSSIHFHVHRNAKPHPMVEKSNERESGRYVINKIFASFWGDKLLWSDGQTIKPVHTCGQRVFIWLLNHNDNENMPITLETKSRTRLRPLVAFMGPCCGSRDGVQASVHLWPNTQIAKFMGPTWDPPGSCRSQMGPMLAL